MKKQLVLASLAIYFISCSTLVPTFIPKKQASTNTSPLAERANTYFWKHFHEGNYDSIPQILHLLKSAYLEDPTNPTIVARIGFTHAWAGSERIRVKNGDANIIDHFTLASKYFEEARQLNPKDVRLLAFHGDFLMTEGNLGQDKRKTTKGYLQAKRATKIWPEWANFTLSYVLSLSPKDSKLFQESIDLMWQTLDACVCEKVDRKQLNWGQYYHLLETPLKEKNRRACWDTWITPHNLEGFFIHFGDLYVKSGDWETGIMLYNNAKTIPTYKNYPYKDFIEKRIQNAQLNMKAFNKYSNQTLDSSDKVLMIDSKISCTGCHQKQQYIPPAQATSYVAPHLKK